MAYARTKYETALAAFATPGGRWAELSRLTYWAKAAGLTADEVITDARAHGVTDRDADIRRGWKSAQPREIDGRPNASASVAPKPPPKPKPPTHAHHVRDMLSGTGPCTFDAIRECSPCLDWIGQPPHVQTELLLRACWRADERLFIFTDKPIPTRGALGKTVRKAGDWLELFKRGGFVPDGDRIVPNPLSGELGATSEGKPSFVAQSCIVSFPYIVMEFDEMPIADQCRFWRAFLCKSKLAPELAAIVFSGGRSLHGLLHVGCATLAEHTAAKERIAALFASDPDETSRADVQAMRPRTGIRLPGLKRLDNGAAQELVYLNPAARTGTMWSRSDA